MPTAGARSLPSSRSASGPGSGCYLRARLDAEIAALGPATVRVVTADEDSLAAIGSDALSAGTAQAALDAGTAQARREISALRAIWPSRGRSFPVRSRVFLAD